VLYRVTIEQEAKNNLRTHFQNLRTHNPGSSYPDEWYLGIREAIRSLASSAAECGLAYEDRFFAERIRHKLYDSYKILLAIRGDRVHVLHIRHQSQNPEDVLP
jgi:plasmid stabilization system protein ParE